MSNEAKIIEDAYANLLAQSFASYVEGVVSENAKIVNDPPGTALEKFRRLVPFIRQCRDEALKVVSQGESV